MIFTTKQIESALAIATKKQSKAQYVAKFLKSVDTILLNDPIRYREYGPAWWPLKKALIEADYRCIDTFIDSEILEVMAQGDIAKDCISAWLVSESKTTSGELSPYFTIQKGDNTEEYCIHDEHMERLIYSGWY